MRGMLACSHGLIEARGRTLGQAQQQKNEGGECCSTRRRSGAVDLAHRVEVIEEL